MTVSTTTTQTTLRAFSPADLMALEAWKVAQGRKGRKGWRVYLDRDNAIGEEHDLISLQPPYATEAVFLIVPNANGVTLSCQTIGWGTAEWTEAAWPSLQSAMCQVEKFVPYD